MSVLESGNVQVGKEHVVAAADPPDDLGNDRYDDCLEALFNYTISPQEAAEQIVGLTPLRNTEVAESELSLLWSGIVPDSVKRPEAHSAMVDLLVALANMPDAVDEDGQLLEVHEMRVWKDLPKLGWDMRYWFEWDPVQKGNEGHKNFSKFAALLTATGMKCLDFSLYGLWSMREALEYDELGEHWPQATKNDRLDLEVSAAAQWIFYAGKEMFLFEHEYPSGGNKGARGKGGPRWPGKHGFCRERWDLWKVSFLEISADESASPATREIAQQAYEKMVTISEV